MYLFLKSQPKHPSCKKSCGQDLKKAVMKKMWNQKDVKSKGGGQGLCRNAVDHIKNLIMMTQVPQNMATTFLQLGWFWL